MNLPSLLVPVLLILVAAGYRLIAAFCNLPHLLNFAPLMAISFCGGIFLPRFLAWIVPLTALFLSDLLLNTHYGVPLLSWPMLGSYGCYTVAIILGIWVRRSPQGLPLWGGVFFNSLLFYSVTNSIAWFTSSVYSKDLSGWIQALTVGEPGYPPTWTFFQHSLLSDLLYTLAFVTCMKAIHTKTAPQNSPPVTSNPLICENS